MIYITPGRYFVYNYEDIIMKHINQLYYHTTIKVRWNDTLTIGVSLMCQIS